MSERNQWIDLCKGIGIVLVVYGHVARGIFNAGIPLDESSYKLVDSIIYSFHMPLFFLLSGVFFFDSLKKLGPARLIAKKVDTIVYPYIAWSLIQGFIEVILSKHTNAHISTIDVIALWQPRAQFWFLYTLFILFIMSVVIYRKNNKNYALATLPILAILYVYKNDLSAPAISKLIFGNYIFFAIGIYFYEIKNILEHYKRPLTAIGLSAFIAGQYLYHVTLRMNYMDGGLAALLLACVSIVFFTAFSMTLNPKLFAPLAALGNASMTIYIMHILAGSGARVILNKVFLINTPSTHLIIGCIVGLLVPFLIHLLAQRARITWLMSAPQRASLENTLFMRTS